jgi:putative DNA primase/helicase
MTILDLKNENFNPGNIPDEMKILRQWVLWRAEQRGEKTSKIPYRADGRRASSTNPDDWVTFGTALNICQARGYNGIGFVFREGGGIVGVDLDHVIDDAGNVESWAARVVRAFDSYTEISVSGHGLHIICRGSIPGGKGHRRGQSEMYDRGRYFTVTGRAYGEPRPLREAQPAIDRLIGWMNSKKRETTTVNSNTPEKSKSPYIGRRRYLNNLELLEKARSAQNGEKFRALFDHGDVSAY